MQILYKMNDLLLRTLIFFLVLHHNHHHRQHCYVNGYQISKLDVKETSNVSEMRGKLLTVTFYLYNVVCYLHFNKITHKTTTTTTTTSISSK